MNSWLLTIFEHSLFLFSLLNYDRDINQKNKKKHYFMRFQTLFIKKEILIVVIVIFFCNN